MTGDDLAARLLTIFVEELGEQVQQLNEHLLELERAPADPEPARGVFRVMHTLKGAARAAGVLQVERLCHVLEGDLAVARDEQQPLGGAQIALLFEAADALDDARARLTEQQSLEHGPLDVVLEHAQSRRHLTPSSTPVTRPAAAAAVTSSGAVREVAFKVASPSVAVTTGAPSAPLVEPAPASRATGDQPRDELVRVGLHHVDAITNAAGEVISLAAVLADRADELAALRLRLRKQRERHETPDADMLAAVDREITRLLRRAGDDARALGSVSGRLSGTARRLRQRSLRELTETLPRVVRDVAHDVGKLAALTVTGEEIEADRVVIEALREPLLHLVRNAVDHGLESATDRANGEKPAEGAIHVDATLRGDRLRIAVSDDGPGLDLASIARALARRGRAVPADSASLRRTIFDDGFSTREQATTLSGRGVGLGIVRTAIERLGGTVDVTSQPGAGTTFTLEVPLSIATIRALTVMVDGATFGIPSAYVARVDRVHPNRVKQVDGHAMLTTNGAPTPLTSLAALLGPPFVEPDTGESLQIVTVEAGGRTLGLVVDDMTDERELVLRSLEHAGPEATSITVGTALLGDGTVVLVLGIATLLGESRGGGSGLRPAARTVDRGSQRILVVDDSITSRMLEQSVLAAAGYDVIVAADGAEGWRTVQQGGVALVVSDVEMPEMDGIELCTRIRADAASALLPVILVTSLDQPAHRARGLEAGADAYLTKSGFDQDVLLEAVRQLLGAPRGART